MIQFKRAHAALGVGLALAVVVAAYAVPALARVPDVNGTIHGCYSLSGGGLRVIDTAKLQTCDTATEKKVTWPSTREPDVFEALSQGVEIPGGTGAAVTHETVPAGTYLVDISYLGPNGYCELIPDGQTSPGGGPVSGQSATTPDLVVTTSAPDTITLYCNNDNPAGSSDAFIGDIVATQITLHKVVASG
jgi:hypothetical protein